VSAHVVIVAGGTRGVGASVLAAMIAVALAEPRHRVLLVDGAGHHAAQHRLFGVRVEGGASAPIPLLSGLDLLPALLGAASTAGGRASHQLAAAWEGGYDLVLIDAGSRLAAVLAACEGGSRMIAVTTGDQVAAAAGYALAKAATAAFPTLPVHVVVTRHDAPAAPAAPAAYDQLRAGAELFLRRPLGLLGTVPDDLCLRRAITGGMTIDDAAVGSPAAVAAGHVGAQLLSILGAAPAPTTHQTSHQRLT
jgi:MinD-like ATPase involved in chromosome partitioning or flagellar assembly